MPWTLPAAAVPTTPGAARPPRAAQLCRSEDLHRLAGAFEAQRTELQNAEETFGRQRRCVAPCRQAGARGRHTERGQVHHPAQRAVEVKQRHHPAFQPFGVEQVAALNQEGVGALFRQQAADCAPYPQAVLGDDHQPAEKGVCGVAGRAEFTGRAAHEVAWTGCQHRRRLRSAQRWLVHSRRSRCGGRRRGSAHRRAARQRVDLRQQRGHQAIERLEAGQPIHLRPHPLANVGRQNGRQPAQNFDALDRVDAQLGLQVFAGVEHLRRVAGALAHQRQQAPRQLGAIQGRVVRLGGAAARGRVSAWLAAHRGQWRGGAPLLDGRRRRFRQRRGGKAAGHRRGRRPAQIWAMSRSCWARNWRIVSWYSR
jgi:hypothetical protein